MTQETLLRLASLRDRLDQVSKPLKEQIKAIEETCDHKYPDGTDACEVGFRYWQCLICFKMDRLMNTARFYKLLRVALGKLVSEDNDQDVNWLVSEGYLNWNDDVQTHEVTEKGQRTIHKALGSL